MRIQNTPTTSICQGYPGKPSKVLKVTRLSYKLKPLPYCYYNLDLLQSEITLCVSTGIFSSVAPAVRVVISVSTSSLVFANFRLCSRIRSTLNGLGIP